VGGNASPQNGGQGFGIDGTLLGHEGCLTMVSGEPLRRLVGGAAPGKAWDLHIKVAIAVSLYQIIDGVFHGLEV
jgi:hypothetical protein